MIERGGGEPLDLAGVEVDRHDAIGSRRHEHVGHQPGRDRLTRPDLLVLAGIPEEGNDGGDPFGRRPLQRIDHDELFHDVVVDGLAVTLDNEAVGAAHAVVESHVDLTVGEGGELDVAQLGVEDLGHVLCEWHIGRPREDHQPFLG